MIAVLALNEGTETTDFLVPHAVLQLAQVGVVDAVAPRAGAVTLMPALQVEVPRSFAAFDSVYPQGADIVVVPALHTDDDPAVLVWLQAQAAKGAVVVGICSGARVLGRAGLLDGRRFAGHRYDRSTLLRRQAGAVHVPGQRYVDDGPVVTTTGCPLLCPWRWLWSRRWRVPSERVLWRPRWACHPGVLHTAANGLASRLRMWGPSRSTPCCSGGMSASTSP